MDRRQFVRRASLFGGLSLVGGEAALAGAASPAANQSNSAMAAFIEALADIEKTYISADYGLTRAEDIAEAQRLLAHMIETGFHFWMESDPERPVFKSYVTPTRKLLGDNPDALYYFAPIRDDREYRIRGNIGAATFTSFTIEGGSGEGRAANRSIAELDDRNLQIDADGNFDILVSRKKPRRGNWLKLEAGAGQITTRHYYESRVSVAANPEVTLDLRIAPLAPPPLERWQSDQHVARKLSYVANFVREHMAMSLPNPEMAAKIPWASTTPNQFTVPGQWRSESGYGNLSAYYAMAPFVLMPDQALEIRGRFPDCRFANIVLWNRFMQTFDFTRRQISLNRNQIQYEADGSFRLYVAHKAPGHPNWLDTEGRASGVMYWRYILPVAAPTQVETRIVNV